MAAEVARVAHRGLRKYLLPGETPVAEIRHHRIVLLKPFAIVVGANSAANALARDGAGLIEVQLRLQKSLAALARLSASRRRARVRRRLREQIADAAQTHVIDPVEAELSRQERLTEALVRIRG